MFQWITMAFNTVVAVARYVLCIAAALIIAIAIIVVFVMIAMSFNQDTVTQYYAVWIVAFMLLVGSICGWLVLSTGRH